MQRTPRGAAAGGVIAWEELLARLELAERELGRLRSELADERAASARQSREWSTALHALEAHPAARGAVLDAIFGPRRGEAESPVPPGRGLLGPAPHGPAGRDAAGASGDPESQGAAGDDPRDGLAGRVAAQERPKGVAEQMREMGLIHGRGGLQPELARRRPGDHSRDEILDPGSPGERGRGKYGDEFPG